LVKTPYVMAGYLDFKTGRPDPLYGDWFRTGDIGCLDTEGNLFITARKKDLIIRGGINISPRTIEEIIIGHPSVDQAAVIGVPHEFYGEDIVALIKLKPGFSFDDERSEIEDRCKQGLSMASMPSRIEAIEYFPMNTTGKIQKNILRENYLSGLTGIGKNTI
ncbi:hypothetical protein EG833_02835, partial [archaeon]|nr:hypothetical protein [archaeon]